MTTTATLQMTSTSTTRSLDRLVGAATIVGPGLLLASSVAWAAGADAARAPLMQWGFIGFGLALLGFGFRLLQRSPNLATALFALAIVTTAAGGGYSAEMAIVDHFGIERLNAQTLVAILVLNVPGTMFPVSLLLAAFASWRTGLMATPHAGVLALGAVLFPVSRIPEVAALAIGSDLLVFAALAPIGLAVLRGLEVTR
jgi:hypothetical protein